MSAGRKITQWSEREFVQHKFHIWFGSDSPKTISAKEISDNGLDQISDGIAKCAHIRVSNNSIMVMDSGHGISINKDPVSGKTHLFLAVGKLYTSSNYEGTSNITGTNGVGATATNALSKEFKSGIIEDGMFKGYVFHDGVHSSDGDVLDKMPMQGPLDYGFYVEAEYDESILTDPINIPWLKDYIEKRVGELPEDSVVYFETFKDGVGVVEEFNKIRGNSKYVKSWEEKVQAVPGSIVVDCKGGWKYAFSKTAKAFDNISPIAQGAPLMNNLSSFKSKFEIEEHSIAVTIPYSFYYSGKEDPKYTDQTKRRITIYTDNISTVLKKSKEIYEHYYREARAAYLAYILKNNDNEMFWPALGPVEEQELIIAEGFSAISGIKNKRNSDTQACIALIGKILNVMQKDIKNAMKSPVVKNILAVLMENKYKRVIIAVDADEDGSHICTLILGLLHRFCPWYLEEGRVFYLHTPLYVFKKGKDIKWSDHTNDCPAGYRIAVKKGLGSLNPEEIKMFITNPDTRDLWQFEYDMPLAEEKLKFALVDGGEGWIAE